MHNFKHVSKTSVCCLLSTVYCQLSTVYCLLSTVYCLLSTVYCYCLLSTVHWSLLLYYSPSVADHARQVRSCLLILKVIGSVIPLLGGTMISACLSGKDDDETFLLYNFLSTNNYVVCTNIKGKMCYKNSCWCKVGATFNVYNLKVDCKRVLLARLKLLTDPV